MKKIGQDDHKQLAIWAADCTEIVLPQFEALCTDNRLRNAIEAARAWSRGEQTVGECRKLAFAAHTAARDANGGPAVAAARAAGHAAATAHVPSHDKYAAMYAAKVDRGQQLVRLPEYLIQWLDLPESVLVCMS